MEKKMSSLSRREEFAKAAMQSLITTERYGEGVSKELIKNVAYLARLMADAQLTELRENPSEYKTPKCDTGPG